MNSNFWLQVPHILCVVQFPNTTAASSQIHIGAVEEESWFQFPLAIPCLISFTVPRPPSHHYHDNMGTENQSNFSLGFHNHFPGSDVGYSARNRLFLQPLVEDAFGAKEVQLLSEPAHIHSSGPYYFGMPKKLANVNHHCIICMENKYTNVLEKLKCSSRKPCSQQHVLKYWHWLLRCFQELFWKCCLSFCETCWSNGSSAGGFGVRTVRHASDMHTACEVCLGNLDLHLIENIVLNTVIP